MGTITVKAGRPISYKAWRQGPVVTFSHGWPLNADMWDGQMLFLAPDKDFAPCSTAPTGDDQIVPVKESAKKSAKLIKGAREIYYPGLPHGLTATHADFVNRDLLAFCQQEVGIAASGRG